MPSGYFLPPGVWEVVTSFLVHNIRRHGAHLCRDDAHVAFNAVVAALPRPVARLYGPKIIYTSFTRRPVIVKFAYDFPFLRRRPHRTIFEHQVWREAVVETSYEQEYRDRFLR